MILIKFTNYGEIENTNNNFHKLLDMLMIQLKKK